MTSKNAWAAAPLGLVLLAGALPPADWRPALGPTHRLNGDVHALQVLDDGSGPALYATGAFTHAGPGRVNHVARWNADHWLQLGEGLDGPGAALARFDAGAGPELYVGGAFTLAGDVPASNVARWDGLAWQDLAGGLNGWVADLEVFDDGSGPALYAGGEFQLAGGVPAANLARWDGTAWSAVGSGTDGRVLGLAVHDDGTGAALYVSGSFFTAGGIQARSLARWDGADWSTVGDSVNGHARPMTVFDDGSGAGPQLYAGGSFDLLVNGQVEHHLLARWDGADWHPVGDLAFQGILSEVNALHVHDDGRGPALYVGGRFATAGGVSLANLGRWDGSAWESLGSGVDRIVLDLATFTGPNGRRGLFAGGSFQAPAGGDAYLACWQ